MQQPTFLGRCFVDTSRKNESEKSSTTEPHFTRPTHTHLIYTPDRQTSLSVPRPERCRPGERLHSTVPHREAAPPSSHRPETRQEEIQMRENQKQIKVGTCVLHMMTQIINHLSLICREIYTTHVSVATQKKEKQPSTCPGRTCDIFKATLCSNTSSDHMGAHSSAVLTILRS